MPCCALDHSSPPERLRRGFALALFLPVCVFGPSLRVLPSQGALDVPARPVLERLVAAAVERTHHIVRYDGSYVRIPYPGGDVPASTGVCTDEVIRAYRAVGIDLQKEVHIDMLNASFRLSAKMAQRLAGLRPGDPPIRILIIAAFQTSWFFSAVTERPCRCPQKPAIIIRAILSLGIWVEELRTSEWWWIRNRRGQDVTSSCTTSAADLRWRMYCSTGKSSVTTGIWANVPAAGSVTRETPCHASVTRAKSS